MSAIITGVIGRRVWDSRGRPTIEADVVLANGARGRAIAPAGASRGSKEAIELRDGGTAFGGMGVERAVASVVDEIASKVTGIKADNQASLDNALIELDGTEQKSRLGGNASVAAFRTARELGWRNIEAMDRVALIERLSGWCRRYPIISIEDPLAEDDDAGMAAVTEALGREVQIIGDDYLVTSAKRMRAAATSRACNAVLLKPNQAGTLTETVAAFRTARELGWRNIVSARSGETEDVTIVHLAIGWGAEQLKVGSFARSERMAKWNEGIRIEQAAKGRARFKGRGAVGGSGVPLP